ncbi:MAG: hypothetical protein PWR07_1753 [Bacillota bacterium]|nr:hypothetical protein [Bacillota bacterium]MDI6637511.1 hypothetical protein [Bacillota bacterium]MDK2931622.1 hypothetical protein [Bacillota bacterium]
MQLNIYVPKEKATLIRTLEQTAKLTGRPKNELIIEALERYLPSTAKVSLGQFHLGEVRAMERATLYEGRLKP